MSADSAFWTDLEARFRALSDADKMSAYRCYGHWLLIDGPPDDRETRALHQAFTSLAQQAGSASGAPNLDVARDWWLDILRKVSPRFESCNGTTALVAEEVVYEEGGGWIHRLALASAEQCSKQVALAFASEVQDAKSKPSGNESIPPEGRREIWARLQAMKVTRKTWGFKADVREGEIKKWLSEKVYKDGSRVDNALRKAASHLLTA